MITPLNRLIKSFLAFFLNIKQNYKPSYYFYLFSILHILTVLVHYRRHSLVLVHSYIERECLFSYLLNSVYKYFNFEINYLVDFVSYIHVLQIFRHFIFFVLTFYKKIKFILNCWWLISHQENKFFVNSRIRDVHEKRTSL